MTYPPQQPTPYQPPPPDPNAGLRQAGTVALWVWITLTLIPVVIILGCIGLCAFGVIGGAVTQPSDATTP